MKRVTLTLRPSLIVPDDAEPILLADTIAKAILTITDVERVEIGRPETGPAQESICQVGHHHFYVPQHFTGRRPVPDICPAHAHAEHQATVLAFHQPLFTEITRLTGLNPLIWHSGGGTMTIVVPLNNPAPDADWSTPCYMGLVEDTDDDGRWYGSVGYYATEEQRENGDETTIVAWGNAQHPQEWATLIAAHYRSLTPTIPEPAADSSSRSEAGTTTEEPPSGT